MNQDYTWDQRYQKGKDALPWDTGEPAQELIEFYEQIDSPPPYVLEIGCGSGTNAIWMAGNKSSVVATDISPAAIAMAKEKCKSRDLQVEFLVSDIMEATPVPAGSVNFVFDRGVYHVMAKEHRRMFIDRVAEALSDAGYWLCLAGNADQIREPGVEGPPQLTAGDLIDPTQEQFELYRLERSTFELPKLGSHLAWKALFRKRNKS